jgi:chromosome segregation ATPase
MSMGEQTRTPQLEQRVRELETALAEAEGEMGKVVSRMNRAQIEVAELQGERYVITLSLQSCTGTQTGVL